MNKKPRQNKGEDRFLNHKRSHTLTPPNIITLLIIKGIHSDDDIYHRKQPPQLCSSWLWREARGSQEWRVRGGKQTGAGNCSRAGFAGEELGNRKKVAKLLASFACSTEGEK